LISASLNVAARPVPGSPENTVTVVMHAFYPCV